MHLSCRYFLYMYTAYSVAKLMYIYYIYSTACSQCACSMHTAYIHIVVLYMISFKFIAWVQGMYSPKTGCILLCFLILCGNMFPDIVHVHAHIVVLYMICFTFTV